jgi:hypothetical protein
MLPTADETRAARHQQRIAEYDADLKRMGLSLLKPEDLRRLLSRACENVTTTAGQGVDGTNRDAGFFSVLNFESADGPARFLRGIISRREQDIPQRFLENTVGIGLPGNFDPRRLNHLRLNHLFIGYSQPWNDIGKAYVDIEENAHGSRAVYSVHLVNSSCFSSSFLDL